MESIECIFCNTSEAKVVIRENGYCGNKCANCGLIYLSPRHTVDEIADLYGHNNAQISAQMHIESDFFKRLYAKHNLKIIQSHKPRGKLLEIGAGAGYFLDEAKNYAYEPYALEFNTIQAKHIREELDIPCEESTLGSSSFRDKKFDIIYHCDVLSHFYDPISEFKTMYEMLDADGLLIFETGNFAEIDPRYYRYIDMFQYPDHLFFFGVDNIIELLDRSGFELVSIHRYSLIPQLKLKMTLVKLLDLIKKNKAGKIKENQVEKVSTDTQQEIQKSSPIKQKLRFLYQYFTYILRYKIGSIVPKNKRPQTIILIAKKRLS